MVFKRLKRHSNHKLMSDPNSICADIVLNDTSPSMTETGFEAGKTKRDHMHEAAETYLETKAAQRPQDYVAIIGYDSDATMCCGLMSISQQYQTIWEAAQRIKSLSGGGTQIALALKMALDLITREGWVSANGVLVRVLAYSDGHDQSQELALMHANELKRKGVLIETFGIARDRTEVAEDFLRQVASETNGFVHYRFLGDADTVRHTFKKLATGMLVFEG